MRIPFTNIHVLRNKPEEPTQPVGSEVESAVRAAVEESFALPISAGRDSEPTTVGLFTALRQEAATVEPDFEIKLIPLVIISVRLSLG
jgi:hypothetical protein